MNTLKQISEIFEARKDFKEGIFFIDGEEQEFKGIYKDGNLWNGFYNPYFTLEEAKKVLAIQDTKEDVISSGCSYYELSEDVILIGENYHELSPENLQINEIWEDGKETFNPILVNGVYYFPIGYYNWVWVIKTYFEEVN